MTKPTYLQTPDDYEERRKRWRKRTRAQRFMFQNSSSQFYGEQDLDQGLRLLGEPEDWSDPRQPLKVDPLFQDGCQDDPINPTGPDWSMTLESVGVEFEVTRGRIGQIEARALHKFATRARKAGLLAAWQDSDEEERAASISKAEAEAALAALAALPVVPPAPKYGRDLAATSRERLRRFNLWCSAHPVYQAPKPQPKAEVKPDPKVRSEPQGGWPNLSGEDEDTPRALFDEAARAMASAEEDLWD